MPITKLPKQTGVDTSLEFEDSTGRDIPAAAIVDENGDQAGISSNPLITSGPTRSLDPEHITLQTSSASAVGGSFSVYTTSTIKDILIQNLSAAGCFITWDTSGSAVATSNSAYLAANGTLTLDNASYTHFSVIREGSTDVTIRITGIG